VACVPAALNSGLYWPRRSFLKPPGLITVEVLPIIPPGLERRVMFERVVSGIESASEGLRAARQAR
jgi:1-acyl-sn-glycerol-3-phosphate acyltransferase